MRNKGKADSLRTNRDIRAKEVRLISPEGEQEGIVPIEDALAKAEQASLDLVEVAPDSTPPVCRIYDYKKAVYEKKKKMKESKKKTTQTQVKEVKARVAIDPHDLETKINRARKFLEKGDKVKFTIIYRGREITKPQLGEKVIQKIKDELADIGEIESPPSRTGKLINLMMSRRKDWNPQT